MMTFKELVQSDNKKVFLNPEEFGSSHMVGNTRMCIIIDDNEMIEREKRTPLKDLSDGVYKRKLLIYVTSETFGPLPSVGRMLLLDNRQYRIIDAINEDGVYSISLEATRPT